MEGKTVPHPKDYVETAILRDTNVHKMYQCLYITQLDMEFPAPCPCPLDMSISELELLLAGSSVNMWTDCA